MEGAEGKENLHAGNEQKPLERFAGPLAPLQIQPQFALLRTKKFTCDVCLKGVGTKGGLKYHIQAHLNGRRFKCDKCPKSYATKNDLDTHYKRHLQQFECDFCNVKFSAKDYVKTHISANHLPKVLPCVNCCKKPKFFATKRELRVHCAGKLRRIQNVPKFVCKLCRVAFEDKKSYDKHCENRELLKYKCKACAKLFPCYKLFQSHMKEEKSSRFCKMCNVWVTNFSKHAYVHHKISKCDICNFETSNNYAFHRHVRKCGSEEQIKALGFQCAECSLYFRLKLSLDTHMNKAHTNFQCGECNRKFNAKINYERHMRDHLKRHFKCVCCAKPKNFSTSVTFHKHFDYRHGRLGKSWAGAFICGLCERKSFQTKDQLVTHMRRECTMRATVFGKKKVSRNLRPYSSDFLSKDKN